MRRLLTAAALTVPALIVLPPPATAATTTRFRAFNLNICASVKGGVQEPTASWQARADKTMGVFKGRRYPREGPSGAGASVVALSEVRRNQYDYILAKSPGYRAWPDSYVGSEHGNAATNPILWRAADWRQIDGGYLQPPAMQDRADILAEDVAWVGLVHKVTGQELYVASVHDPAQPGQAQVRLDNALFYASWASEMQEAHEGAVVGVWGDFNAAYVLDKRVSLTVGNDPANLSWAVIEANSPLRDAYRAWGQVALPAPSLDHQLTSSLAQVEGIYTTAGGPLLNGTDIAKHPSLFVDYLIERPS